MFTLASLLARITLQAATYDTAGHATNINEFGGLNKTKVDKPVSPHLDSLSDRLTLPTLLRPRAFHSQAPRRTAPLVETP